MISDIYIDIIFQLQSLGIIHEYELLAGLVIKEENFFNFDPNYLANFKNYSSWGSYDGLSFKELVALVTDDYSLDLIERNNPHITFERIFFPRFGICLKAINYSANYFDFHLIGVQYSDILIYPTDESKRTIHGPDLLSQTGEEIRLVAGKDQINSYIVDISILDNTKSPDEDFCNPDDNYNYLKCVDDVINKDLVPKYGCVPEWLSDKKPCTVIDNSNFSKYFIEQYASPYFYMFETEVQKKCRSPCQQQVHQHFYFQYLA